VVLYSEIYQVTGPVARFARQIAGHGYIVAAPSSYHDFVGPEPLAYDVPGTDLGNKLKVEKVRALSGWDMASPSWGFIVGGVMSSEAFNISPPTTQTLPSYDADTFATVDYLLTLPTCTGLIGATGMCLGGHLALRACVSRPRPPPASATDAPGLTSPTPKLDTRITACVAYFATDVHIRTLGPNGGANSSTAAPSADSDHTLDRLAEMRAEVAMIFGVKDTHVPPEGRDLIRAKLRDAGVCFSFHEFAWAQHAFIRDELSKGRYDPAVTKVCFEVLLELFGRALKTDLGARDGDVPAPEHVC
jgi:carboxymethylenebutenolidase